MAKEAVYEVLSDTLTVHQMVAELKQSDGSTVRQNGRGKVYLKSEKIKASEISPDYIDALEDKDNSLHSVISAKLKKSTGDSKEDVARRLALPFDGFDEMDEDQLYNAMVHLPSAVISRIKEYETGRDDPRERILGYSVGYAESNEDRQLGIAGSDIDEPLEGKPTSELETRNTDTGGLVQQGDGMTGIGVPPKGKLKNPGATLTGVKAGAKKRGTKKGTSRIGKQRSE